MKTLSSHLFLLFLLIAGTSLPSSGCRRKKDTIAKVYVVDQHNQPVSGATVSLIPDPTIQQHNQVVENKVSSTNRSGEAIFIYNDVFRLGQAGVAVMKIQVDVNGSITTGIIKIDQETTSEETIVI